jgi:competence protein ComEA
MRGARCRGRSRVRPGDAWAGSYGREERFPGTGYFALIHSHLALTHAAMNTTPQERLALGVVALLLAAGAGARALRSDPPAAGWTGEAAAAPADAPGAAARLRREAAAKAEDEARRSRPLGPGERIDPNTAPAAELDRLPKVGPALAERIAAHRARRGRFRTLADLDSVPGVGPSVLAALAPHVTLPAPPSSPPPRAPRTAAASAGAPGHAAGAVVDLNTATAAELATLPGIGPALAQRIVDSRARNGRFRSPADLARVPGIGAKTVERLAGRVRATP